MKAEMWAYIGHDGKVIAESELRSEAQTWDIALGWPTPDEIAYAKSRGDRVARVTVEDIAE